MENNIYYPIIIPYIKWKIKHVPNHQPAMDKN